MHDDGDGQEEGPVGVTPGLEALAAVVHGGVVGREDPLHDGRSVIFKIEVAEGNLAQVEEDRVDWQDDQKHVSTQLRNFRLDQTNLDINVMYLFTEIQVEITIEVKDHPEDSNDGVVDAHMVDLDVLDVCDDQVEGVVVDVDDLV